MLDYNNFAKTFSTSRKWMKWQEIEYFLSILPCKNHYDILDIGCWNGRLIEQLNESEKLVWKYEYTWLDISEWLLKEAKNTYPHENFFLIDMIDISWENLAKFTKKNSFDIIFFIASFHHLDSFGKRKKVLSEAKKLLKEDGIIFMTNWDLHGSFNKEKYKKSEILQTENEFGSKDFSIKIGKYHRFYHSFSLFELEKLFFKTWFFIEENRLFENERNIISIIKKK